LNAFFSQVQRPAAVDAASWAAWKRRDKVFGPPLMEARVGQLRDARAAPAEARAAPTLLASVVKYEDIFKAADKLAPPDMAEHAAVVADLTIEGLLWAADACCAAAACCATADEGADKAAGASAGESLRAICARGLGVVGAAEALIAAQGGEAHSRGAAAREKREALERGLAQVRELEAREKEEALRVRARSVR
jgi:hypothetical protein